MVGKNTRASIIDVGLTNIYPEIPSTPLKYSNDWELLVAVILSAQCTDEMVNKVTDSLFLKYKRVNDYAHANINEFERDIHSTGFYRNKAKNIIATADVIRTKYDGNVPSTMSELTALRGVGRKTANVILGNLYGIPTIPVDTHVIRLSNKFGLTTSENANIIERELQQLLPKETWWGFSNRIKAYGREYSPAHVKDDSDPISQALKRALG